MKPETDYFAALRDVAGSSETEREKRIEREQDVTLQHAWESFQKLKGQQQEIEKMLDLSIYARYLGLGTISKDVDAVLYPCIRLPGCGTELEKDRVNIPIRGLQTSIYWERIPFRTKSLATFAEYAGHIGAEKAGEELDTALAAFDRVKTEFYQSLDRLTGSKDAADALIPVGQENEEIDR